MNNPDDSICYRCETEVMANPRKGNKHQAIAVFGVCMLSAWLLAVPLAAAQTPQQVLLAPAEISAACLCLEREIARTESEYRQVKNQYDARDSEAKNLAAELERRRANVDTNDERSVDAFRQLLGRLQSVEGARDQIIPPYQAAALRHNAKVSQFSSQCTGKWYDGAILPQVQATLICPAE